MNTRWLPLATGPGPSPGIVGAAPAAATVLHTDVTAGSGPQPGRWGHLPGDGHQALLPEAQPYEGPSTVPPAKVLKPTRSVTARGDNSLFPAVMWLNVVRTQAGQQFVMNKLPCER